MTDRPIIGWEQTSPVPADYQFNHFLSTHNGRLFIADFDLATLFEASNVPQSPLPSPLEVVYLPLIRSRIRYMCEAFEAVIEETGYQGAFRYTYASKANAAEEVIRTTLGAGAHHEMSSTVDVDIARLMIERGILGRDRMILSNGFKPHGSDYATNLVALQKEHGGVIPIIEDLGELPTFIEAQIPFDVGLRQKSYGKHADLNAMDAANSRFGMQVDDLWRAADYIAAAPNLTLKMFHGMVGSQLVDREGFVGRLTPALEMFAQMRQRHPDLSLFNFGGGMPIPMTLDFEFDYHAFIRLLLTTTQKICKEHNVAVPDIVGEFGRYTTSEHGAHIFKVIASKDNGSDLPWYIIDGSIMSSFPDSWALQEHFIVLPLNHLDKPFQQVQLGGITCDSDDVFPPKTSTSPLYLPVDTDELHIGFFSIGAYQEMLGGVRGSKHCVLPEANEIVIDLDADDKHIFEIIEGQTPADVLNNLGYRV